MTSSRSVVVVAAIFILLFLHHGHAQDSSLVISGDVIFAVMSSLNDLQNGVCGSYDVRTLQSMVAVTWFVEAHNEIKYIPGVTLGLDVYRTCKIPEMATEGAIKLLNKYGVLTGSSQNNTTLFGMLGPGRTSEGLAVSNLLSSLPVNQRVLQISGSATGKQLSDNSLYPNFFRVIPPDDTQVRVIIDLLLELQWNYVAIVYDDDDYGRSAANELLQLAEERQVCVPVFASLPIDTKLASFTTKATQIANDLKSAENGLVRGVVILGGTETTHNLLQALSQQISYVTLVLSEAVALQRSTLLTPTVSGLVRGTMVTTPPYLTIPEVNSLWNDIWTNRTTFQTQADKIPWLNGYFTQVTGCSSDNGNVSSTCWQQKSNERTAQTTGKGRELSFYVSYQVKATAVMAALLQRLHEDLCGGSSGVCPQLSEKFAQRQDILNTLRHTSLNLSVFSAVSATFASMSGVSFNADTGDLVYGAMETEYAVFNFRRDDQDLFNFQQIGEWKEGNLTINTSRAQFYDENQNPLTWSELPPAHCDVNHDCVKCERDVNHDVIFVEGDFYVVGIVPVSDKNSDDVLSCGAVKPLVGADLAQSLVFAVDRVNQKSGIFRDILPNRRVGLIVINSCGSPLLVRKLLMDLHAGTLKLPGNRTSSELQDNIMGYVGPYFSAASIAAAETLNELRQTFVQVSAASTSPDLSNTTRFPYFLRLHTPDDQQAKALLDIVQTVGANYIQVIYDSSTTYATGLYQKLEQEVHTSDKYNICIAQSIATTPQDDLSQYFWIKDRLRQKSDAKIVIVILHHVEIEKVMDAILPLLEAKEFLFIATEAWGRRFRLLEGVDRYKLAASLVLSQEVVIDQFFQAYFQNVQPETSINPWLAYFWEAKLNCYFNKSFRRKGKAGPCPADFAQQYVQDVRVPFHINAVNALVLGFHTALTQLCGPYALTVCDSLTSDELFSAMLTVKLDLYGTGQASEVFDSKGDGLVGYKVLQVYGDISTSSPAVRYMDVGNWGRNRLELDMESLILAGRPTFQSLCPDQSTCTLCFSEKVSNTSSTSSDCDNRGALVAAFVSVLVILIIIIIVLVVLLVIMYRRQKAAEKAQQTARLLFNNLKMHSYDPTESESEYYTVVQDTIPPPRPCERNAVPDTYIYPVASAEERLG